eukprot:3324868-Rhodomonas_salina.2
MLRGFWCFRGSASGLWMWGSGSGCGVVACQWSIARRLPRGHLRFWVLGCGLFWLGVGEVDSPRGPPCGRVGACRCAPARAA